MTSSSKRFAAAAAVLLAICAGPPVTAQNRGTISVEQSTAAGSPEPTSPALVAAIGEALAATGFTVLTDAGHSAYVAELTFSRTDVGTGSVKTPSERGSITPGMAGMGGGVTLPLSAGNTRSVPLRRFQLELWVRKRGTTGVVWRGAAVTVRTAGTEPAERAIALRLSEAILRGYPAQPRGVIGIP